MGKNIFVIEDDESIRNNLRVFLESEGYMVETASDGREALKKLRAATSLPSLIILDLMMPIMDGYEFRKEQELDPRLSKVPVVIATAAGDTKTNALKFGVQGFIKKPFSLDDMIDIVDRFRTR